MDARHRRLEYLRKDPRVSLKPREPAGPGGPDAHDAGLVDIDRLSQRYLGSPFRVRDQPRVSAWIAVDRWHGWDPAKMHE